ncbi:MAG TPA: SAM-dependent methyltransferase, partial [Bacteroidia bacterium]|nr:SAM-dependent methyltransferase [Bacteroidia bacterium]
MELALYHPEHGYYSRALRDGGSPAIGRGGDFYTSVSVGETFGLLLAHRIAAVWEAEFDHAGPFVVVEQGGHDGRLARDIVAGLEEVGAPLLEQFEYRIVEPRESIRCRLERDLGAEREDRIRVVGSLGEARAPQGIFLCNELLDAFPVDLLIYESGEWRERWVGWCAEENRPMWVSRPLRGEWAEWTASELTGDYPEGYRTEVCLLVDVWMEEAAALFHRGLWWVIDYGYERTDYYLPQRTTGTLRTYRQ